MNCSVCGKELRKNAKFCAGCGECIENCQTASPVIESEETTQVHHELRRHKESRKRGVIITVLITAILIVSAMIAYLLFALLNTEGELSLKVNDYPSSTEENTYIFTGTVVSEKNDATVTVDGEVVANIVAGKGEHNWSYEAFLDKGKNTFTVTVTDEEGKKESQTVEIVCNSEVMYRVHSRFGYGSKENAQDLCNEITEAGFEAIVVKVDGDYRVQCGAFSKYENANDCVEKLAEKGFKTRIVTEDGTDVSK